MQRSWCVVFKTSEVVAELGNSREHSNYLDVVFLEVCGVEGKTRMYARPALHL